MEEGSSTGRQRRVATLTPEIRETRKREKSRRPYWIYLFLDIEKGPAPPSTCGNTDGHRVQIYVSNELWAFQ